MEIFYATVSRSGSIIIPVKLRKESGIVGSTVVSLTVEGNSIVLRIVK